MQTNVLLFLITTKVVSGKTYKSDYRAILSWVVDKAQQKTKTQTGGMNDFIEMWKEAKEDEQSGNDTTFILPSN